uniref:60S ribosomal protein L13 n=2 Tax=Cafeteria roenbergensis TaxID=33653 RepID=A0A7S0K896_CAFRO|mmetsp:Transcript_9004/g.35260  ORF Transcript_9004/g.35260 Transcript_9004/m.35260 type:complete len:196 (+) Transcript_9004:64-651(+)
MVKHNNVIPNSHFHKQWQRRVKTWFDQPAKKAARRQLRKEKAAKAAPRPVGFLRPAVHCQTARYNMRVRAGRGFTLAELKAAGVSRNDARTIGIAVDYRRRNKSQEALDANVARLRAYLDKVVWNKEKPTGKIDVAGKAVVGSIEAAFPVVAAKATPEFVTITDAMRSREAYKATRELHNEPILAGIRISKAREE